CQVHDSSAKMLF
nr:immunoglobulin light chain junction region [Macaca mulatta]